MVVPDVEFCYLTTTGRVSGRPHEIEIWYGVEGRTIFMLSGGGERSDWVRNLLAEPSVSVRIDGVEHTGSARRVTDPGEDDLARRLLAAKYQGWRDGGRMSDWARTALAIAVDL
ncbi:MAG TPA: nitroreductase/quinone reductase family protein [Actinomycetota bacterium]|nr:nitroreductase/quinone reductase family protein [Actinomycetota bacterium]